MNQPQTLKIYRALNVAIALVWVINGLFCKVLKMVPRHQVIVGRILGSDHAAPMTTIIGSLEVIMAIWVISGMKPKWCALVQVAVVAAMNIIEFIVVPDLLLFGRINSLVALFFISVILLHQYYKRPLATNS